MIFPNTNIDSNGSNSNDGMTGDNGKSKKKKSRWGGTENDKTFIPGMPTILPATLDAHQQEAYLGEIELVLFNQTNKNF